MASWSRKRRSLSIGASPASPSGPKARLVSCSREMKAAGWAVVSPNGEQRPEMEARSNRGREGRDLRAMQARNAARPSEDEQDADRTADKAARGFSGSPATYQVMRA